MLKSNESRIFRGSSELVSGRHARVLFPEILGQQLTVRQRFQAEAAEGGRTKISTDSAECNFRVVSLVQTRHRPRVRDTHTSLHLTSRLRHIGHCRTEFMATKRQGPNSNNLNVCVCPRQELVEGNNRIVSYTELSLIMLLRR